VLAGDGGRDALDDHAVAAGLVAPGLVAGQPEAVRRRLDERQAVPFDPVVPDAVAAVDADDAAGVSTAAT